MKASTCIWLLGLLFAVSETAHFGWNWSARTDAEMVCDCIVAVIYALAFLAGAVERNITSIHINKPE
jgi:hypothetical protein